MRGMRERWSDGCRTCTHKEQDVEHVRDVDCEGDSLQRSTLESVEHPTTCSTKFLARLDY